MTGDTVVVTGGNGKIGSAVLADLNDHGYETVNVSREVHGQGAADAYITADLLDAGETYGAIAKVDANAVVHMGTIPNPYGNPDHRVYESNTLAALHVLEAAESLGVESVVLPSSINAMGSEHQRRPVDVRYLPVDEAHPRTPDDVYGIAKDAMEVTAEGYGRRPDSDLTIASLRFPWVATDEEIRATFVEADRSLDALADAGAHTAEDVLFSYLHVADAAAVARAVVEADFEGHEAFWAVAADTTAAVPTATLAEEYYPDAEVRDAFEGHESLVDISKAADLLGWEPERSWRDL
jgi:nucleoside-diphosphate-sugar epimerase